MSKRVAVIGAGYTKFDEHQPFLLKKERFEIPKKNKIQDQLEMYYV